MRGRLKGIRYALREVRELGLRRSAFRIAWEMRRRSGILAFLEPAAAPVEAGAGDLPADDLERWPERIALFDPTGLAEALRGRIPQDDAEALQAVAREACDGTILCFGRRRASFGSPIDWHLNPASGERWNRLLHWSRALAEEPRVGDVKQTWEVARFPQAYHMARAAVLEPRIRLSSARSLASQIQGFLEWNPPHGGIHWASGQEVAFRLLAWVFAMRALFPGTPEARTLAPLVAGALVEGATHIARFIGYARHAVYNNHLLSEALGLLLAARCLPAYERSRRWAATALEILEEESERQFHPDGAYIQNSHNYHRLAVQVLLAAAAIERASRSARLGKVLKALARSVDFLHSHQSPSDGRLPNYGSNDGGLPLVLSTCDFSDFRPTLQAASVASRGERIYEPGPWDEEAAWLLGLNALDAPLRPRERRSVCFVESGYHVIRGIDAGTFAAFRCGSVKDRFSQIDMLHLDVWWRGENVLVDGGSYLYNGADAWQRHFHGTASHNTLTVDGLDQMVHHRRFKNLYPTPARLLRLEDRGAFAFACGEHEGYRRPPIRPRRRRSIHRRSVLVAKDDLWVVVDQVIGKGLHTVRLHWLCGQYPYSADEREGRLELETPQGPFSVSVLRADGRPFGARALVGCESPIAGWQSRYYGEKAPVPALIVEEQRARLPWTAVTILAAGRPRVTVEGSRWEVAAGRSRISFEMPGRESQGRGTEGPGSADALPTSPSKTVPPSKATSPPTSP